jgi:hypothetical protein
MEGAMHSAKKRITPIDMEIIYRAYRSVWSELNYENRVTDSDRLHDLRDRVTRKLVEVAREGVIDLETLRERTLAAITQLDVELHIQSA